jgi:hypothetical protein
VFGKFSVVAVDCYACELTTMTLPDGITDGVVNVQPKTTPDTSAHEPSSVEFWADSLGRQGAPWTLSGPPSKPLVGILGDVDGRIVPVAPRQFRIPI